MKKCRICGRVEGETEFHPKRRHKCLACYKTADMGEYQRAWRAAHPEACRAYEANRARMRKPPSPEAVRRQYERKMKKRYGEQYEVGAPGNHLLHRLGTLLSENEKRQRRNARTALRRAVRRGKIARLPCFVCGKPDAVAHHPTYAHAFAVTWLCTEHHREVHAMVPVSVRMRQ